MYIASPHETYYEYAKAALKHKKHVLCEKPMVFLRAQAEELFELSKEQGCVLMEENFTRLTDPAMLLGVIGSAVSLCIALAYLILKLVN